MCLGDVSLGVHLFTFRTEKLSPVEPMIVLWAKVGSRQDTILVNKTPLSRCFLLGKLCYTVGMNWRTKRQSIGIGSVAIIILVLIAYWAVGYFTVEPTCFDREQNGDELGIDCGGSCALRCSFETRDLVTQWQRVARTTDGVYSVVAYIENQNTGSGAYEVPYRFRLYDDRNLIVAEKEGTTFVGSNDRFAIVEPNLATGNRVPTRAFFEFLQEPVWQKIDDVFNQRLIIVKSQKVENADTRPRVTAVLENTTLDFIYNIEATVVVYDLADNVIQTGLTVVPQIAALGEQEIFFTWPEPFSAEVGQVEVIPRINIFAQ